MFLSNWLVFKIVLAAVTGLVDYPLAVDVLLVYDNANKLYLSGGSLEYVSNVVLYKGEASYEISESSQLVTNYYITQPGTYRADLQICGIDYKTNEVEVTGSVTPEKTWGNEQKLLGETASDYFGYSVSISGDYAIVGAPYEDTGGSNAGAAYIYTPNPSTGVWGSEQKILGEAAGDEFGKSVSISGDYAIVGAPYEDTGASSAGAAYIYTRSGTTWGNEQKILGETASDLFGWSVSISGDYAIVGAQYEDTGGTDAGAAYIYTRSGTTWGNEQKLLGETASDYFGYSVSISGDYAIVGSPGEDTGASSAGAAYIYTRSGTTWGNEQKILGETAGDNFGYSVSISGDYAIVGAPYEDTGASSAGATYIYTRSVTTWGNEQKLLGEVASDFFGWSVAIDGGNAIVGAQYEDTGASNACAAYIYELTPVAGLTFDGYNQLSLTNTPTYRSTKLAYGSNVYDVGTLTDKLFIEKTGEYASLTFDTSSNVAYFSNVTVGTIINAPPSPSLTLDTYNKLSIENITPTATTLRLGSNTYEIGTASNVYIEDTGTYEIETKDANTFALVSNVVSGTISPHPTDAVPSLTHDGYNKLSIENITPTATSLRLGSNTYDIGTASNVYIEDTGTYEIETKDANTFALVSNVVTGTISPHPTDAVPSLTFDTYNKLSIENITPTATNLRLDSNTYEIGTASNVYIEDTGTYEIE